MVGTVNLIEEKPKGFCRCKNERTVRQNLITINVSRGETSIPKGAAYFSSGLCIRFTLPMVSIQL